MPSWVEARAKRIMKSTEDKYGPERGKQIAFALATQQSHASGKSPRKWKGKPFGTPEGRREAKEKYDLPKSEYQKTAEEPALAWLRKNFPSAAEMADRFRPTMEDPYPRPVPLDASLRALGDFPQMLRSPIPAIQGVATRNLMGFGDTYNRFRQLLPTMWTDPRRAMEMAGRGSQASMHLQDVLDMQTEDASRPSTDVQSYLHPIPSRETPDTRQVRLRESPETAMSQNRSSWWGNTGPGAGVPTPRIPNLSGRTAVAPEGYTSMEHTASGVESSMIEGRPPSRGSLQEELDVYNRAFESRKPTETENEALRRVLKRKAIGAGLGGALGGLGAEGAIGLADVESPLLKFLLRTGGVGAGVLAGIMSGDRKSARILDEARQTKTGSLDQWNRETIEGRSLPHGTGEQPSPKPTRAQPIPVGMPGGGEAYFSPRQVGWLMSQGAFRGGGESEKAKPSVWPRVGRAVLGGALGGIGAEVLARGADVPPEARNLFRAGGVGVGLLASQLGEEKRAALAEGYLNQTLKHVHFLTKEAREKLAQGAFLGRLLGWGGARAAGSAVSHALPEAAKGVVRGAGRAALRGPTGGRVTAEQVRQHLVTHAPHEIPFARTAKGGIRFPGDPPPLPVRAPVAAPVAVAPAAAPGIPEGKLRTMPGVQRPSMSEIPEAQYALLPDAQRRLVESARLPTVKVPSPPPVPGVSDVFHMRQGLGGYALGPSDLSRATTLGSTIIPGEALHPQLSAQLLQGRGIRLPDIPRPDPAALERWMGGFRGQIPGKS